MRAQSNRKRHSLLETSPILPNFFIVGAPRSGTTSVVDCLRGHQEIFLPELKEPKYFSVPDNTFPHRGPGDDYVDEQVVKSWNAYVELFAKAGEARSVGEASVDYLFFPGVPKRLHETCPLAQILVFLRNPAERAFSTYTHMVMVGRESLTFEEALEEESKRKASNWEFFWRYREVGYYYEQVERYIVEFGKENVHIFFFEDLQDRPSELMGDVLNVLGVCSDERKPALKQINRSGIPRWKLVHNLVRGRSGIKAVIQKLLPKRARRKIAAMATGKNLRRASLSDSTRRALQADYRESVEALQSLTGRNLCHWMER